MADVFECQSQYSILPFFVQHDLPDFARQNGERRSLFSTTFVARTALQATG
jgi:hypothetical protein